MIRSRDREEPSPLLLSHLPWAARSWPSRPTASSMLFATGASPPPLSADLSQKEIDRLISPARARASVERSTVTLQETDWPLIQALAQDGRATYRQLAARTHWHESTVRRRVEELIASGVLSFDVDLTIEAIGFRSRAMLWMSVVPAKLDRVGRTLADLPEVPFVAATTGPTNLVAAVPCQDDRSLCEFITDALATFDGVTHIETAPVMRAVKLHATLTRAPF